MAPVSTWKRAPGSERLGKTAHARHWQTWDDLRMSTADEPIAVRPVVPASDTAYRGFLLWGLALAVLVGFVIGTHVPVGRLTNSATPERTQDLIQAHGQVQLLGFAGLYVMGMSLRLLPRFASARIAFSGLVVFVLWTVVVSLAARSLLLPWFSGDAHDAILLASLMGVALASGAYLLIVAGTVLGTARRPDASSAAFVMGAFVLFVACDIALITGVDAAGDGRRTFSYLIDTAIVQLELTGFLLVIIAGVAMRALPTMVGLERPVSSLRVLPPALALTSMTLACALLYLEYVAYSEIAAIIASLTLGSTGVAMLSLVWMAGVLRPARNRIRPSSQPHLWLLRGAFVWLVFSGALMVYAGAEGALDGALPSQMLFDAIRHVLGVGVVTALILGMSLMILPEFAVARQRANRQRELALFLAVTINVSAMLRVVPSLAGDAWSFDARNASIATAGTLAEIALLAFAVYFVRLVWQARKAERWQR